VRTREVCVFCFGWWSGSSHSARPAFRSPLVFCWHGSLPGLASAQPTHDAGGKLACATARHVSWEAARVKQC
jgi:hypothetical protein